MSKCLTVVAFALLMLSGAMGLRNIATHSAKSSASVLMASGLPMPTGGGGHITAPR